MKKNLYDEDYYCLSLLLCKMYIFFKALVTYFFQTLKTCDGFFFFKHTSSEDIDCFGHYIGLTSQVLAKPQDKDS